MDDARQLLLVGVQLRLLQQPDDPDNPVHRRADLVAHGREEGTLRVVGLLGLFPLHAQLLFMQVALSVVPLDGDEADKALPLEEGLGVDCNEILIAVLGVIDQFSGKTLPRLDLFADKADCSGTGVRALEESAGLPAPDFLQGVAGNPGKALVDPLDVLVNIGDDNAIVRLGGNQGKALHFPAARLDLPQHLAETLPQPAQFVVNRAERGGDGLTPRVLLHGALQAMHAVQDDTLKQATCAGKEEDATAQPDDSHQQGGVEQVVEALVEVERSGCPDRAKAAFLPIDRGNPALSEVDQPPAQPDRRVTRSIPLRDDRPRFRVQFAKRLAVPLVSRPGQNIAGVWIVEKQPVHL